jgi:hypothetical protein
VFPGAGSRKEPRGFDLASGGAQVGSAVQMLSDHVGERLGERRGFLSEGDAQFVRSHHDRGGGERSDPDHRLGVQQQQRAGDPGRQVCRRREGAGGLGLAVTDLHGLVDLSPSPRRRTCESDGGWSAL